MSLDNIFTFFITCIGRVFYWFYDLDIPIFDGVSVDLGDILISIVLIGLVFRIFLYFNDFTSIFVHRDEDGRKTGFVSYHGGKRKQVNYYDNYK